MKVLLMYEEPINRTVIKFVEADINELELSEYQRSISKPLVSALIESFSGLGFITPIICVEEEGRLIIVDGQHRLEGLKKLGVKKVLCLVLPAGYKKRILDYNIEKPSDLKTKCIQVRKFYEDESLRNKDNSEFSIAMYIKQPYYITFGYALLKEDKLPVGLYESFLKKIDKFLDKPLLQARNLRILWSSYILDMHTILKPILDEIEDYNDRKKYFNSLIKKVFPEKNIYSGFSESMEKFLNYIKEGFI